MRDGQYPMAAPAKIQPLVRSYSEPAVSVMIPVGPGHAKYLPAALDSLLGQTCRDWEVIVVVDGYDELRPALDATRAYPFIRWESNPQREGVAYTRNAGLSMARAPSCSSWMPTTTCCPRRWRPCSRPTLRATASSSTATGSR
jgi:hypothetical protein